MDLNLTKTEKTIAVSTLAVVLVFFACFSLINKKSDSYVNFATESGINYKMARPEQAYSEYTLEGRDIDQMYEGLPVDKKELAKRKKELIAKQKANEKKKADEKKKQTTASQLGLKKSEQTKDSVLNSKNQRVAIQKKETDKKRNSSGNNNENNFVPTQNVSVQENTVQDPAAQVKPKKTFTQWRNEIFADPTAETVGKFIQAHKKNEVSIAEVQAMAQDLIDQENNQLKGLGLLILRSAPSLASLSQLVHEQATLPPAYQNYVEQALIAYFYPQNLGYFRAALLSQDRILQNKVLSVLQINLTRLSQGDQTVFIDPRNVRTNQVTVLTMNSFVSLLPVLGQLSNSQQPDIAQMAQQVASLIQTHNNIAQN